MEIGDRPIGGCSGGLHEDSLGGVAIVGNAGDIVGRSPRIDLLSPLLTCCVGVIQIVTGFDRFTRPAHQQIGSGEAFDSRYEAHRIKGGIDGVAAEESEVE